MRTLKDDAQKSNEMQMLSRAEYHETEFAKTDMFLFVKYVNPSLYKKHFGGEEEHQEEERSAAENEMYTSQVKSARLLFSSAGQKAESRTKGFVRSLFQSLRSYVRYRTAQDRGDGSQQLIEVFDVLLRSKQRLQLFDLSTQQDLLLNAKKSNYMQAMQVRFEGGPEANGGPGEDNDSVYLLDTEPEQAESLRHAWDLSLNDGRDFEQVHLIRFEIDKTRYGGAKADDKKSSDKLMKITDIDLWMGGNRHCVVKKE